MKKLLLGLCVTFSLTALAQEADTISKPKVDRGNFFGGFESNSQWYLNDKGINISHPEDPIRSNNYLFLNYVYKNWSAGIQAEAYEENALLNYNPKFNETNIATYFVRYANDKVDVTAGYFYEQFGSGILFRSWEDRALGINNALRGGRVIFRPAEFLTVKGVYGRQRSGFDVANSDIFGTDVEFNIGDVLKFETTDLSIGGSFIRRDEKTDIIDPNFKNATDGYAARVAFGHNAFYFTSEYNYKTEDAIVQVQGQIDNEFVKPGSALLFNAGYSTKGFGMDATFRRIENMSFFSERDAKGNAYNDKVMNFVPSLTKQHHFNLSNIYVYQAQPNVILTDASLVKTGEIGGQIDLYYDFQKGTKLGGKYGTKVAINVSNWNALGGTFNVSNPKGYDTDFFGFGKKYFSDYNLEISKKFSNDFNGAIAYINQYYDKKLIEETSGLVKTNIIAAEGTYKFSTYQSLRLVGEHMWADSDKGNWASATAEFNINSKYSVYAMDMYNYGNEVEADQTHYYNIGGAFRKGSTRIALAYGRQRGGLVCVGGVCRYVEESTGLSLSLNTTF